MDNPIPNHRSGDVPDTHSLKPINFPTSANAALNVLVIIAVLYTLYFCRTLLLPVLVAGFIALFSSPLVRFLTGLKLPHPLAAALVVIFLVLILGLTFVFLGGPATRWLSTLPELGEKITAHLNDLADQFHLLRSQVMPAANNEGNTVGNVFETIVFSVASLVAGTTAMLIVQVAAVFVITYFFLVYGDNLMRNLVRSQSSFSEKKKAVIIFQTVRDDISRYALLISIINIGLGIATACVMAIVGVEDPLLWGTLAAILNFAPYVGPLLLSVILTGVGFLEYDSWSMALLVPGSFLALNFIESQLVTPTVLGQRFNMNPLLVVLWMFVWSWLWGVIGLLIAIPLLVCFKILSLHLNLLGGWINLLDGDVSNSKE